MVKMVIRQFKSEDRDEVFNLHVRALKKENGYLYRGVWEKDFDNILDGYINNKGDFIVGIIENKIVAMGGLREMTQEIGEIRRMRVDPSFHRKGLGQTILNLLEKKARALKAKLEVKIIPITPLQSVQL
jgi:N-acetylglutamate synthase-like GNAT family acetyltransferase